MNTVKSIFNNIQNQQNTQQRGLERHYINCEIHGERQETLINGICRQCKVDKEQKELAEYDRSVIMNNKRNSNISERFINANFDNYIPTNKKSEELLKFCKNYEFDKNIILIGKVGNGKTHLACALIDKILKQKKSAVYIQFYKLTHLKINKPNLFEEVVYCDFLVIDEYGVQESDFKTNLLFEIINERYNEVMPTMLISNLSTENFKKSLSEAVISRLKDNHISKTCDWEDYRIKKQPIKCKEANVANNQK
jgi:DNA replication protein DnaC